LIDNDAAGGSGEWLDPRPGNLQYIGMDHNAGFARANNIASAYLADCEWIALVNPDAFLSPSWLGHMLDAAASHPEASFFACRLVMDARPSILDGAGDIYHASGLVWRDRHGTPQRAMPRTARDVFSPCAAAALYRRQAFADAGGFDEDFFCYVEDVDLGFRLRLSGHRCRLVPHAVARHVGSAATGGRHSDAAVYYGHRNLVWAYVKNVPGFMFWALLPGHLMMNLAGVALFAWRGSSG
jgi:GT2 family glycosyltransferase